MKHFIIVLILLFGHFSFSQVGIGNTDPKATLDISSTNVAAPTNTDGILIPKMNNFPATNPTIAQDGMMVFATGNGTPTKGFYYWNQSTATWTPLTGSIDSDWFVAGTVLPSNSINDNIYTQGNVSVGSSTNILNGHLNIDTDPLVNTTSISNSLYGTSSGLLKGIINSFSIDGSANLFGIQNSIGGTGTGNLNGVINQFSNNSAAGSKIGFQNTFLSFSQGSGTGLYNRFNSTYTSSAYGVRNEFVDVSSTATIYGLSNVFATTMNAANVYGAYTSVSANVTGNAYGYYATVNTTGTDYGIYSSTTNNTIDFAAYLIGRTSLGNTTTNRYLMPAADGSAGQAITTNGAGQLSFTTLSFTDTDDQFLDVFSLTGTTLNLSLDNDGIPTQTINLSSLQDGTGTDDQNLVAPTLTGTTLNLNIENGTGTSINLAALQDGIGTDDQRINSFGLSGDVLGLSLENDGDPIQTVDLSNLSINISNFALAKVTMSAFQTLPLNVTTKINFDTTIFDLGSNFNTTTDQFIASEDGYYRISAMITSDIPNTTNGYYDLSINVNGLAVKSHAGTHYAAGFIYRRIESIQFLNAGQYVEINLLATSAITVGSSPRFTALEIERIR